MAKRPLEQEQNGARAGEELEELKQALRDRAVAMGERERELDRIERKLALRERRLGRRMRMLRTERSWFTPVKNRRADPDEVASVERQRSEVVSRELGAG